MGRRSSKARRHPKARPQGILDTTPQGFGFVKTAEGEFFIPASKMAGAFPGDMVEVARISPHDDRSQRHVREVDRKPAARVVKVLLRSRDTVIGRYEVAEPFGVVVPEDPRISHDIFTLRRDAPQVKDGDIVEVRITGFPSRNTAATGKVVRVLGSDDDVDVALDLIIADHRLETEFSEGALDQAAAAQLDVEGALAGGYRDLRDALAFTIDPVDARDFDDAVSLEQEGNLLRLGVHIADVSRLVPFGSSMDLDARRRATSVYLVDRVLPMLPERLSNDLCSLVPGQDRCCLSVEALLSRDGRVQSYEVLPSVIRSKARLSYEQAQALLDARRHMDAPGDLRVTLRNCEVPQGALPLDSPMLAKLQERIVGLDALARALFARRRAQGCMDFDRVEAKVRLDEEGHPLEVRYRRRTDATVLIEEAMILANHLVAEWLSAHNMPCVFRVHEAPDGQSLRALYEILQESALFKDVSKRLFCAGNPQALQDVLSRASGLPQQELVNALVLRSMARAVYTTRKEGHYGLALAMYCHFTSPIRRYPDLLVHRLVKEVAFGREKTSAALHDSLPWMAEHSSKMEREAEAAARESQLVKIVELMEGSVGQVFTGIVSNVSTFGVTVRLENTATGTIPADKLGGEYFSYDAQRHLLRGIDTERTFRLGQRLRVVLTGAYPRERRLAFRLAEQGHSLRLLGENSKLMHPFHQGIVFALKAYPRILSRLLEYLSRGVGMQPDSCMP